MSDFPDTIEILPEEIDLTVDTDPSLSFDVIEPDGSSLSIVAIEDLPVDLVVSEPKTTLTETDDIEMFVIPGLVSVQSTSGSHDLDIAEIEAAEDIPALSFVTAGGNIADSANNAHANRVIGITMDAVLTGFIATCVVEGEVTDSSWNFAPNAKLFLNGTTLSTTPVSSGFSQLVGITRNAQTVFIRLQIPIKY